MNIRADILAEAKKQQTAGRRIMFLGNGSVVPVPGGQPFEVYATDVDLHTHTIFNGAVPNNPGQPVWVEMKDKKLQVTGAWNIWNNYIVPQVGPHWHTHAWGAFGSDIIPIAGDQWTPWIVQPATTTDYTINILRTPINTSSGWVAGGTETHDMASHIPGSGARYVLLSVNASGAVVFTDGGTESTPSALTIADYPALPSGNRPLYLIMLYHGMTPPLSYTPNLSTCNFIDLRHMQAAGYGSLPTLDTNRIVVTDGSGAITTNPNLNYNSGAFVMGAPSVPFSNASDFHIVDDYPALVVWGYDATGANAPSFVNVRGLGSVGSPAAVPANTVLARFRGKGWYDGTHISNSTELRVVADEDWSGTNQGTRIELWGTPDGATTPQLLTTIYGDGRIVSANDIEITDATKGIILKDTVTGTRYRISVTSGVVTASPA